MLRLLFILLCFIPPISWSSSQESICQKRHCVAIVDAGSTGSRLHIYAYDLNSQNTPIHVNQLWTKKIKPGLSSVENTQESIDLYLNDLFAQVPEYNIPVYFYATAGMRLISKSKQLVYYHAIENWFLNQPQLNFIEARTITGVEEGTYGWLAVNYSLGALESNDKPLVALMDMGGASVQVAIPIQHIDSPDVIHIDLFDRHISLYVHSFLGLGQTEMSHQYLNEPSCFPVDYILPNDMHAKGNAVDCQLKISKLINVVHDVQTAIKPELNLNPDLSWYTISGLSTLVKSKPFIIKNNQFTGLELLQQANNQLCQQPWQTLNDQYPDNEYSYINCLTASYYYALMVHGYGLKSNQIIHVLADQDESDWTLGVVFKQILH